MPNTPGGLPYPNSTDPVANGAQDIQDLATAVDTKTGLWKVSSTDFTNQPNVLVNNCFPTRFTRFRVMITSQGTTTNARWLAAQLAVGGTPANSNYFTKTAWWYVNNANLTPDNGVQRNDLIVLGPTGGTGSQPGVINLELEWVNLAAHTGVYVTGAGAWFGIAFTHFSGGGTHAQNTAYDGIYLFPPLGNNITGNVTVYGYLK